MLARLAARRFWVFYRFYHDFDHFVVSAVPASAVCCCAASRNRARAA